MAVPVLQGLFHPTTLTSQLSALWMCALAGRLMSAMELDLEESGFTAAEVQLVPYIVFPYFVRPWTNAFFSPQDDPTLSENPALLFDIWLQNFAQFSLHWSTCWLLWE